MVNPLLITPILEIGKTLIDKFFPDKEKAREAEVLFLQMAAEGELKQVIAQLEINAREAAHPSIWVSGWRPAFGWSSCVAFLYATVLQPMLAWGASIKGWPVPPSLNLDLLWVVITGMLGIGGMRSLEKIKQVSK